MGDINNASVVHRIFFFGLMAVLLLSKHLKSISVKCLTRTG